MEKSNVSQKTFRDYDSYFAAFESFMQSINDEYQQKISEYSRQLKIEQFQSITEWFERHTVDQTPDRQSKYCCRSDISQ